MSSIPNSDEITLELEEEFRAFLILHQTQLINSNVPQLFWPTLFYKLRAQVYDAGPQFQMQQVVSEDANGQESIRWRVVVIAEDGLSDTDSQNVFLIDHAWTFKSRDARMCLNQVPGLLDRMSILMNVQEETQEEKLEGVLKAMWKYIQTYKLGQNASPPSDQDALPSWYIMDEFGTRIQHSDEPTVNIVPFFYADLNIAFSIMWPLKTLREGEEVTRDYCQNVQDPILRSARLLPWIPEDLRHIDFKNSEPGPDYFSKFAHEETLPSEDFVFSGFPRDRNVKVFLEQSQYRPHLSDPKFELTNNPKSADILWYSSHYHDFRKLSERQPSTLINQFPREMVLTVKDLLAVTARRAASENGDPMKDNPPWMPITYNLQTELPQFVSYFQHRKEKGLDNHWICKPWNLARAMDIHVSADLSHIVRLPDAGPKVACKYVEDPVLFYREDKGLRVKFDVRYMVFLTSVHPLKVFVHKVFFLRFANKAFALDQLDEYEKHFTVMNYKPGAKLMDMHYYDFVAEFEAQYPKFPWVDIENHIFNVIKELMEAATKRPPPEGIGYSPQSRAFYGVDLMLGWGTNAAGEKCIMPKLCEVNYAPDLLRACRYYPNYLNEIFSIMFLDETDHKDVVPL